MRFEVFIRPRAIADVEAQSLWYRQASGAALSLKFERAVMRSVGRLGHMPMTGRVHALRHPRLGEVRSVPVRAFRMFLVMYSVSGRRVDVVRVMHGARDLGDVDLDE